MTKEQKEKRIKELLAEVERLRGTPEVSVMDRLTQIMASQTDLYIDTEFYRDSVFGMADDKLLWELQKNHNTLWLSEELVFSVLYKEFSMSHSEAKEAILYWLRQVFWVASLQVSASIDMQTEEVERSYAKKQAVSYNTGMTYTTTTTL